MDSATITSRNVKQLILDKRWSQVVLVGKCRVTPKEVAVTSFGVTHYYFFSVHSAQLLGRV